MSPIARGRFQRGRPGVARGAATATALALALAGCAGGRPRVMHPPSVAIPPDVLAGARPIGRGARFQPPVRGRGGGPCRAALGPRFGVHVELFAGNRVIVVAAGIGVRPPVRRSEGRIVAARCFGPVATIEPTGVVLVRAGARLHLSALFRAWGQPLTVGRLAGFAAGRGRRVQVYVGARPWRRAPAEVPLTPHAEIVLEVGPYVPPHRTYTFPLGL